MVVLSASDLEKNYGYRAIFEGVSLELQDQERVAVVGPNGSGKSTLLRILAREEWPDKGSVSWRKGLTVGYVAQMPVVPAQALVKSVIEEAFQDALALHARVEQLTEAMAKAGTPRELDQIATLYDKALTQLIAVDGYQVRSRVDGIVRGFGFSSETLEKPFSALSGGEKTKVALARALVASPECLILDEPTNHLDLPALEWLEEYLRQYPGTVIVVSHDRYFLDRVVNRVWEVDAGSLMAYEGTYSDYVEHREERLLAEFQAYKEQQAKIHHMEAAIKRLRDWANRSHPPSDALHRRASSIQKALDRMVRLERSRMERKTMGLDLQAADRSGKEVFRLCGVTQRYGERTIFQDVQCTIGVGERVGLVGANGAGKSTLLRVLTGAEIPIQGEVAIGVSVQMGVLTQQIWETGADLTQRVIDRFRSQVAMETGEARRYLARFLFYGDNVFRPVNTLSGGEQMRLRLAELMRKEVNTLVLDEPTNHLDIQSREVLEDLLENFPGTLLVVSHDRYFLNRRVSVVYWLEDGQLTRYEGRYDEVRDRHLKEDSSWGRA